MSAHATQAAMTCRIEQSGDDEVPTVIGTLLIGEAGKLTLVDALELLRPALQDIVDSVNGEPTIRIKVPPPGAEASGFGRLTVPRDDNRIAAAIVDYFEQRFDLRLVPDSHGRSEIP